VRQLQNFGLEWNANRRFNFGFSFIFWRRFYACAAEFTSNEPWNYCRFHHCSAAGVSASVGIAVSVLYLSLHQYLYLSADVVVCYFLHCTPWSHTKWSPRPRPRTPSPFPLDSVYNDNFTCSDFFSVPLKLS